MSLNQKLWRRLVAAVLLPVFLFAPAEAVSTSAASAAVMDVDSGRLLYAWNAEERHLIASTTKIMTALVALELGSLQQVITVSRDAAAVEGTSMYLEAGEQLTLETLLYGLLLSSGNDAAVAIAEGLCGSVDAFAAEMNETARALGMTGTSFANPNGLDQEQHYSTALDMAKLACAAVKNETLVRIASTRTATVGGRTLSNHNKLLRMLDGCIGLKTGYTKAAGRTLVSCVERNGQRLVVVTLQDGNDWADHESLYDWAFSAFPARRMAAVGTIMAFHHVQGSDAVSVPLVALQAFSWPVGVSEVLTCQIRPCTLRAPVTAGSPAGEAVFLLDGEEVGRIPLVCGTGAAPQ